MTTGRLSPGAVALAAVFVAVLGGLASSRPASAHSLSWDPPPDAPKNLRAGPAGQPWANGAADGTETRFTYDECNRIVKKKAASREGTRTETLFPYDKHGRSESETRRAEDLLDGDAKRAERAGDSRLGR